MGQGYISPPVPQGENNNQRAGGGQVKLGTKEVISENVLNQNHSLSCLNK